MMNNISIGVEIECVLNKKLLNLEIGSYHSGTKMQMLKGWTIESDSSLESFREFEEFSRCCEFVSPVFKTKKAFLSGLRKFQKFISNNGQYELFEVLSFNESCGSHVHFSIEGFHFSTKVIFEIYPKVRKYFTKKLLKSPIESRDSILYHYDRSYAQLLTEERFSYTPRNCEFNLVSEMSGKGLEWRSLNLLNIRTWREFFEFWHIVCDCLKYLYRNAQKYEILKEIHIIDLTKLKKNKKLSVPAEHISYKSKKKKTYSNYKIILNNKKEVCDELNCAI